MLPPTPAARRTVPSLLATTCAFAPGWSAADESSTTIAVVPDLPRMDRDHHQSGSVVHWSTLGTTAVVLGILALAVAAAFLIDRFTAAADERRRRSPPPSILDDWRR